MRRLPWIAPALLLLVGCTAGVATDLTEPVRPAAPLAMERLAVLPVTAEPGSEDAVPAVTTAVMEVLRGAPSAPTLVVPEEARDRLGRSGLVPRLARLFTDYETTGIADAADLSAVARALGTRHLLQIRVGYHESEVLRRELFGEEVDDEDRRDVLLVARLWEAGRTAPVWEATARAGSETDLFSVALPERSAMLARVARGLLERIPLEGRSGGATAGGG